MSRRMMYVDKLEPSSCMHRMCVAGARASAQKENIMLRRCLRTQSCKLLWPRNYVGCLKANWNWWLHACTPISSRRMVTGFWICTRAARATRVDNQETMAGGGDANRAPNHGGILSAISDVGNSGFFLQTELHLNECSLHE